MGKKQGPKEFAPGWSFSEETTHALDLWGFNPMVLPYGVEHQTHTHPSDVSMSSWNGLSKPQKVVYV